MCVTRLCGYVADLGASTVGNDTKIAALFRPRTQELHRKLEEQIVDLLRLGPLTRYSIADKLDRGVNCVCAPVKALLDAGVIVEGARVTQRETGNLAWTLKLKEAHDGA